ncbi:MAG: hypothetical protein ACM359_00950, partial [Bacillota bacterium]
HKANNPAGCGALRDGATDRESCSQWSRGELNPRPITENPTKTGCSETSDAESDAHSVANAITQQNQPGLQAMAKVWANLPEQTRSEILRLIQAATPKQD